MKQVYAKKVIGYLADDHFYCKKCWEEYFEEKKMTEKLSIDEEVWEHDLLSGNVDEIEGATGELSCQRCGRIFVPEEPWKRDQVLVHE